MKTNPVRSSKKDLSELEDDREDDSEFDRDTVSKKSALPVSHLLSSMNDRGSSINGLTDYVMQSQLGKSTRSAVDKHTDGEDEYVKSISDVVVPPPEGPLDPEPQTHAGQARFFYYDNDKADINVKSTEFDGYYEHGATDHLNALVHGSETIDKEMFTFGSRPATAEPVS